MLLYDPANGWRYGFPKEYIPIKGEPLAATLLRDGYPQAEIDAGGDKYCRFIGERDEINALPCLDNGVIMIDGEPNVGG